MKYLIQIYSNPESRAMWESFSPEQQAEGYAYYQGINDELGPWVSMSMPKEIPPGMTIEDVELDVPVGRSWIKLGVPVRRRTASSEKSSTR